jgi:hypothetical protein
VNMAIFEATAGRTIRKWEHSPSAPPIGRAVGAASLIIWIAVIFMGRMIGFTSTRATVGPPPAEVNFEDIFEAPPPDNDK